MEQITYGSLFSGIGGFDLGFDRAGMRCAWQVEIDPFCQKVLTKHWPDVPKHKDVRNVGRKNLSAVDIIIGGFPCQPHSVAGKRRGKDDDRNLWPEYLRIVKELKPTWVVGENVPGLKHTMLDEVLSDLEGAGYEVQTFDIPAVALDAKHRRHRLFIIAHANGRYGDGGATKAEAGREAGNYFSRVGRRKTRARANGSRHRRRWTRRVGQGE